MCDREEELFMTYPAITFGEIRKFCSLLERISVCEVETTRYENYASILEVPHTFDGWYLHGLGLTAGEFGVEGGLRSWPCIEFMLSETPRKEDGVW